MSIFSKSVDDFPLATLAASEIDSSTLTKDSPSKLVVASSRSLTIDMVLASSFGVVGSFSICKLLMVPWHYVEKMLYLHR